jgi:siroheme synthase-like protein
MFVLLFFMIYINNHDLLGVLYMLPLVFNLNNTKILVAGGGIDAEKFITPLLEHDPDITVLSPSCTENIKLFGRLGRITLDERWAEEKDINHSYKLIFAMTSDDETNAELAMFARRESIPVFVLNNPMLSDFSIPETEEEEEEESSFERLRGSLQTRRG